MNARTEAFSRLKIDARPRDAGWGLTDGSSVLDEHTLPDGTRSDYVLCDRQRDSHDLVHVDTPLRHPGEASRRGAHGRARSRASAPATREA